jgi:Family of unknown function (DUF6491)
MSRNITSKAIGLAASAAILAGAGLSAPVVSAQPAAGPSHGNQCFLRSNINGFQAPDDRTVYIRVGVSDIYRLTLMVNCTSLSFRQGIGLESTPGDPWICSPIQATVVYRDVGIHNRCPVSDIHKLTPDEIAALPKRDLP